MAATAAAAGQPAVPEPAPPQVERVRLDRRGRPGGTRFGTLVHAVLALVDLDAPEAAVERLSLSQGRVLGATAPEVEWAARTVVAALAHPILRRAAECARTGGDVRREAPVILRVGASSVVEGVMDLAFRESAGAPWVIVDFKTDAEIEERREEYACQVELYARAIREATGAPAAGVLMVV
jgi:ATP-dependent exoDNAse (exonuclease V) beta subunit